MYESHYTDRLIKELGIGNSLGNPTYTPTTLTEVEILDKHMSVLCSFVISTTDEELDLPLLYWIHCVFMKHSWTNSFNLSFSFERGIIV
jgi:hypothetical protein